MRLEQCFKVKLPESFHLLYAWHDGQKSDCYDALAGNFMFMSVKDILSCKKDLDGMIETDFEDPDWWERDWLPFLDNGGGDHLCLDLCTDGDGKPGQLVEFWHEDADRPVPYDSLDDWLEGILASIEDGSYQDGLD